MIKNQDAQMDHRRMVLYSAEQKTTDSSVENYSDPGVCLRPVNEPRAQAGIFGANGAPLHRGDVIKHITDGDRGVISKIIRLGDKLNNPLEMVGDIAIQTHPCVTRVTNKYREWVHVPHEEQTYSERFLSWKLSSQFDYGQSRSEQIIDAVMAILPMDIIDYNYHQYPASAEELVTFLVKHLNDLSSKLK